MDDSIRQLIESSKSLLNTSNFKQTKSSRIEKPKYGVYRNTPTGILAKQSERSNYVYINIYSPTELPRGFPDGAYIVLHAHHWWNTCDLGRFCHEVGYTPTGSEKAEFDKIWGYLYTERPKGLLDFKLG